jgi:ATP-dependent DNA helicase RecQ
MVEYAETSGCRRALILRYFGEQASDRCGNCDNCEGSAASAAPEYPDDLFAGLLALRFRLARDSGRPPYLIFEERTAREIATYRPRTREALLEVWGMGETRVRWFGDHLLDLVCDWEAEHPRAPAPPARPRLATKTDAEVSFDDPLYQRLRGWRLERARSEGVPAYTLFTDRTARELAVLRPRDEEALRTVWGMGDARVRAFGSDLLAVIANEN